MNMLGVSNEDYDFLHERKQGLYTPYDDRRPQTDYYEQYSENAIIGSPKQYDLRNKRNQETPKNKTSDKSTKKIPENTPKKTVETHKTVAVNSDLNKWKNNRISEFKRGTAVKINQRIEYLQKTLSTNNFVNKIFS